MKNQKSLSGCIKEMDIFDILPVTSVYQAELTK